VCCWAVVAVLAWLTASWLLRITRPVKLTVALQGLIPWAFLPVYVVAGLGLWRRRWALAVTAVVLVVVHLVLVLPAVPARGLPAWARIAPRVTVLSANLYDANATPASAASTVMDTDADVLVLVEISREMQTALEAAGIEERFPYHERNEFDERAGSVEGIYSRHPIRTATIVPVANSGFPSAVIEVGTATIEVMAIHVSDPTLDEGEWRAELATVGRFARDVSGPLVIAGDFNATRWNPQYADLFDDGLRDAVETSGRGLTFSWPVHRLLPVPVMRLDHALGNASVAAVDNHDVTIPGSDHRGLLTTWAIRDH
jgi:endonuclease/exonuclease/phosphatase (EEP) superfamily protein YafD